ncbi:BCAS4 isoform 6 [Pan troglodytes]|uniref:BCAS4 isoform 6 n=1 Tax=Pan troglodytes TaxID=9598 RepID=A0A2J8MJC0_PANTR|nr:BCAS4 isoform 6 [Pan troglodytes]
MLLVDADQPEPVRSGARELALFLTPEPGAEAKEVEETIEGMLLRLEEFCSLADLIRSDTSQILEENIPVLKAKLTEMRGIYAKVDRLEAFVKMVGHHVAFLEADVLQAERDHGAFPQALRRWLGSAGLPSFRNPESCSRVGPVSCLCHGDESSDAAGVFWAVFGLPQAALTCPTWFIPRPPSTE